MSLTSINTTITNSATRAAKQVIGRSRLATDKVDYRKLSHADFASARLRILDKDKRLVPFVYSRAQADLMNNLTGRDLILKARQLGISTAVQGLLYQAAVTGTATTMTLAHDDDGTKTLRRMADRFWRQDIQHPDRGAANARLATYPEYDSEALIATAGNRSSGRGTTATHLHGSEVAFWPDAESIVAGAIQAGNPSVILESTPNGAQGYFYNLCMEALDGNSDWALHFYPWWWDAEYKLPLDDGEIINYSDDETVLATANSLTAEQIKWRRAKQRELKQLFIQEYPEDERSCFLRSGMGYFGDISEAFLNTPSPVSPQSDHRHVAGLDFGQTTDYTALSIVDSVARVQVARLHIKGLPWAEMRRQVISLCKLWKVDNLLAEANSMGTTNIEALSAEAELAGCRMSVQAFDTTNSSKAAIMGNLHAALSEGVFKIQNDPVQRHELSAFTATQLPSGVWRLAASDSEHDDTVIALALSWEAMSNHREAVFAPAPDGFEEWMG